MGDKPYSILESAFRLWGKRVTISRSLGPGVSDEKQIAEGKTKLLTDFTNEYLDKVLERMCEMTRTEILNADQIKSSWRFSIAKATLGMIPQPDRFERYRQEFRVRHVSNTTKIEGNTLSRAETRKILDEGLTPKNKELREVYEVDNYRRVLPFVQGFKGPVSKENIRFLHALITDRIDEAMPGAFRKTNDIGITGTNTPDLVPAAAIETELEMLLRWIQNQWTVRHPLEIAAMAHQRFEVIHPFADGNGRVGRELVNIILNQSCLTSVSLGGGVQGIEREQYIAALKSADSKDFRPLVDLMAKALRIEESELLEGLSKSATEPSGIVKMALEFISQVPPETIYSQIQGVVPTPEQRDFFEMANRRRKATLQPLP
jgi:fido (protein-threonine AMPylation protein)